MEWFDGKLDSSGFRFRYQCADSFLDLVEVFIGGLANGCATDQDDHWQSKEVGLFDRFEVRFDGRRAVLDRISCKKATSDERNGSQAAVDELFADFFGIFTDKSFAPDRNAADSGTCVIIDTFGYGPRLVRESMDG